MSDDGTLNTGASLRDRATHERSQSSLSAPAVGIPSAVDLWSDEIEALVDYGFSTVSRNPSDYEVGVAYRRTISSVLAHTREGWRWEYGSFMGNQGWMWRKAASGTEARRAGTAQQGPVNDGPVGNAETPTRPHHPPEGE